MFYYYYYYYYYFSVATCQYNELFSDLSSNAVKVTCYNTSVKFSHFFKVTKYSNAKALFTCNKEIFFPFFGTFALLLSKIRQSSEVNFLKKLCLQRYCCIVSWLCIASWWLWSGWRGWWRVIFQVKKQDRSLLELGILGETHFDSISFDSMYFQFDLIYRCIVNLLRRSYASYLIRHFTNFESVKCIVLRFINTL